MPSSKFILKSDTTDLVKGLRGAAKEYRRSMLAMKSSAEALHTAEDKLVKDKARLQTLQSREVTAISGGADTKTITRLKKQIALQKKIVTISRNKVVTARDINKELFKENGYHQGAIKAIKSELAGREKAIALAKKLNNEEKIAYARRKADVLQRRATQTTTRANSTESDKDRLLITSPDEQAARRYSGMLKEVDDLKRRGIITNAQATKATQRLTAAQKLEAAGSSNVRNNIVRHIRQIESLIVALYLGKRAYDATLGTGHEYNKLIESETIGLKLLIAQNRANVDQQGNAITVQQKYTNAQEDAVKAMKIAREINIETPHTLGETLQIYKLITPQVLRYGGSLEDVGKITKNVSVSAATMGIEFQQLLKTVDSLMSGQMKESGLKRAMEQFGISQKEVNKTVAEGGNVVQLFIDKLRQVDPATKEINKSWAGVTAQFANAWQEIWGDSQKGLFDSMKKTIFAIASVLKDYRVEIVHSVKAFGDLIKYAAYATSAFYALKVAQGTSLAMLSLTTSSLWKGAASIGVYDVATRKLVISTTALSGAMRLLGNSNAILIALTATVAAFTYASSQARIEQEELAKATDITALSFAKLNSAMREEMLLTLTKDITKAKEDLKSLTGQLNFVRGEGSVSSSLAGAFGIITNDAIGYFDTLKESEKTLIVQYNTTLDTLASLQKQRTAIAHTNTALKSATDSYTKHNRLLTEAKIQQSELVSEVKAQYSISGEVTDQQVTQLAKIGETIDKEAEATQWSKNLRDGLIEGAEAANTVAVNSGKISPALSNATKQALALSTALIQGELARGEISDKVAAKRLYQNKLEGIGFSKDSSSEQGIKALIAEDALKTKLASIEKTRMANEAQGLERIRVLNQSILNIQGETEQVYENKKEHIKNTISGEEQVKALLLHRLQYEKKLADASKKSAKATVKAAKDANKEFKKFEPSITLDQLMRNVEEKSRRFTDSFANAFDDMLHGDMINSFANFFDSIGGQMMSGFITKMSDSLSKTLSSVLSELGDFGGFLGGAAMTGIGMAIDFFMQDTAETPPELPELLKVSDSMANALKNIEEAQYPMLEYTRSMTESLTIIAASFGKIENNILRSDIDFGSSMYQDSSSSGFLFGGRTKELYGSLLDVGEISLDGVAESIMTEIIEKTDTSWWGRSKTSYPENPINVSNEINNDLMRAFTEGISGAVQTGNLLGIDTSGIENATINISEFTITGQTAEEITNQIEQAFSAEMDAVYQDVFGSALTQYQLAGEGFAETAIRIATNMDQVTYGLEKIGLSLEETTKYVEFSDGAIIGFTTHVYELTEAMISGAGGIDNLNSGLSNYMDGFFTEQEQYDMQLNTMTKSFEAIGFTLPKTNEEFRNFAELIDINTIEGASLYGELMTLSGGFAELTASADDLAAAIEAENEAWQTTIDDYTQMLQDQADERARIAQEEADELAQIVKEKYDLEVSAATSLLSFNEDILKRIETAYSGSINYMNSREKASALGSIANAQFAAGDTSSYFDTLFKQLEYEKKISTTREEYAVQFNRGIAELQNAEPDTTLDDVNQTLSDILEQNARIEDAIATASFQAPL